MVVTGWTSLIAAASAAEPKPPRIGPRPPAASAGDEGHLLLAAGRVNARDYGAAGDGVADDTAALQKALATAETKGPVCFVPPGQYRLNGSLVVPPGVTLLGASGGTPHSEHPIGTVLLAYGGRGKADGPPLVTLKPNAVIRNLTIHYPEQTLPEVVPYPWTIRGDGELCQVLDVTMTNPYQAIDFGTCWNELHLIRNVFACPLKTGVYIDQCTDIGRIENVHFNPNFWTRMELKPGFPKGDIKAYLEKNLVGFKIGKTDWEYISNCFVIFPRIGFHFDDFGHGPGNAVVTQSGADICPMAVRVDRTQGHAGRAVRQRAVHVHGLSGSEEPGAGEAHQLRLLARARNPGTGRQARPQHADADGVPLRRLGQCGQGRAVRAAGRRTIDRERLRVHGRRASSRSCWKRGSKPPRSPAASSAASGPWRIVPGPTCRLG